MRVTDDDYKTVVDYCKTGKMTKELMAKLKYPMPLTTSLLSRMVDKGFLTFEKIYLNSRHVNLYKTTPNAPKLLNDRIKAKQEKELMMIKREQEKELRRQEREEAQGKLMPVLAEKKYTVEEATKVIAPGHIRVNGFSGFHGGSGKKARPRVYVGSTENML